MHKTSAVSSTAYLTEDIAIQIKIKRQFKKKKSYKHIIHVYEFNALIERPLK